MKAVFLRKRTNLLSRCRPNFFHLKFWNLLWTSNVLDFTITWSQLTVFTLYAFMVLWKMLNYEKKDLKYKNIRTLCLYKAFLSYLGKSEYRVLNIIPSFEQKIKLASFNKLDWKNHYYLTQNKKNYEKKSILYSKVCFCYRAFYAISCKLFGIFNFITLIFFFDFGEFWFSD